MMNSNLIDHLLSSYGLINGRLSEVAQEFVSERIKDDTQFQIIKETLDFNDAIKFLSELEENATKHVLFQHTPGWTIMLSNSKKLDNFSEYQKLISETLNRETIRIIDTKNGTHLFHMIDGNSEIVRSVSSIKTKNEWKFNDEGSAFKNLKFENKKTQPKFRSDDLTELVKAATQYDLTLDEIVERKFILLSEIATS